MCQSVSAVSYIQYQVHWSRFAEIEDESIRCSQIQACLKQFQEELKKSISNLEKVRAPFISKVNLLSEEIVTKSSEIEELIKGLNEQFSFSPELHIKPSCASLEKLRYLVLLLNLHEETLKRNNDPSWNEERRQKGLPSIDFKDPNIQAQDLVGRINYINWYAHFCSSWKSQLSSLQEALEYENTEIIKTLESALEIAKKKSINKDLDRMKKTVGKIYLLFALSVVYGLFGTMLLIVLGLRRIAFRTPIRGSFLPLYHVSISMIVACCLHKVSSLCKDKFKALTLEQKSIFEECQKFLEEKDFIAFQCRNKLN